MATPAVSPFLSLGKRDYERYQNEKERKFDTDINYAGCVMLGLQYIFAGIICTVRIRVEWRYRAILHECDTNAFGSIVSMVW